MSHVRVRDKEGESPVRRVYRLSPRPWSARVAQFGISEQKGGVLLLRLNITRRPIANKYSDGKMQRTLKRELKVPETDEW